MMLTKPRSTTCVLLIAFMVAASMSTASCFWDGQKLWYQEQVFTMEDAKLEVNKAYSGDGYTQYDFKLKKLEKEIRGLRVAFQWVFADGSYRGMVFQMSVPESGQKEGGRTLERVQKSQFYPNRENQALQEYIKQNVVGYFLLDEQPDIEILQTVVNRNGDIEGNVVRISFRVNEPEPLGESRFWMAWEQYNEYNACIATETCLTLERVIYNKIPFYYYNGLDFGNTINRKLLMNCYWIITASSLFWLLGTPLNLLIYFLMNLYMQWLSFINFFKILIAAGGGYEDEQGKMYSLWNYILQMLIYWQGGTLLYTTSMILLINPLPIIGPVIGLIMTIIIEPFVNL